MNCKILNTDNEISIYKRLAEENSEKGKYKKALGLLFTALKIGGDEYDVLCDIAYVYANMGLFELSNEYWFKFLNKAPKSEMSIAYLELGVNYFYMNDLLSATYYFHKKFTEDGFIDQDNLDEEIVEFIEQNAITKKSYHIAYPFDRADFSLPILKAKNMLAIGDYDTAERIYRSIPKECMNVSNMGELAICYYLGKEYDKAIEVCKDSLNTFGDNVTAYCNLSSIYRAQNNYDKSSFYYGKALSCDVKDRSEKYKLATCAIEQEDDDNACNFLFKITQERTYDVTMNFFYGISLLNRGKYDEGNRVFREIYSINPEDELFKFYNAFSKELLCAGKDKNGYLPLKYELDYPQKVCDNYTKTVKACGIGKKAPNTRKEDLIKALSWAICGCDLELAKRAVLSYCTIKEVYSEEFIFDILLTPDILDEVKRIAIYNLLLGGYKGKFGVVFNEVYFKYKPKKLLFNGNIDGGIFFTAYCLCVAKLMVSGNDSVLDKVALSINKMFADFRVEIENEKLSIEEIAALAVCVSNKKYSADEVCEVFDVERNRIQPLVAKISEDKN